MISFLDITTTILGLLYILFEVRGSLWMWLVGGIMQTLGLVLYFKSGLYADCGMEIYYLIMTLYGFFSWKYGKEFWKGKQKLDLVIEEKQNRLITHIPIRSAIIWTLISVAVWIAIYLILVNFTDSTVPLADSFTTALSIIGIWALAHKYLEQWFIWIAVDIVTSVLYFYKDIPFKASLYALYVIIAIFGYFKWKRKMLSQHS